MTIELMLIWDYDTPTGFDVSHLGRGYDRMCEYECTDRILELLSEHGIASTFACVGKAAEPGPLPYHNPAQIRAIHQAGHEVASHSHHHDFIPGLTPDQLEATLRDSKAALEDCIGDEVIGFVPPWNRPGHHPRKLALSFSERRDSGGQWRHSIATLCEALGSCGYLWTRVAYENIFRLLLAKMRLAAPTRMRRIRPERYGSVFALRRSYFGYDDRLKQLLTERAARGGTFIVWAHPHGIEHDNAQNWRHLRSFVEWCSQYSEQYQISFTTPKAWLAKTN